MRLVVAGSLTAALSAAQIPVPAAPSKIARQFLDALKTSDLDVIPSLTVPATAKLIRENFSVVYDYRLIRESACLEQIDFPAFKPGLLRLLDLQELGDTASLREWLQLFAQLKLGWPCTAKVVNSGGLPTREVTAGMNGTVTMSAYEGIVDVERPGPGGSRATQRRLLVIVNLKGSGFDTGWRVATLAPFEP